MVALEKSGYVTDPERLFALPDVLADLRHIDFQTAASNDRPDPPRVRKWIQGLFRLSSSFLLFFGLIGRHF